MFQITLVGQIRNISTQTTNITYKLDDGTGTIEVKSWVDSDAAANGETTNGASSKLAENMYVRVFGKLKAFANTNKKHVGSLQIRPVADFNEVSYHLLEATVVHLFFTRGPPGGAKGDATNGMNGGMDYSNGGMSNGSMLPAGTSNDAKRIYEVIRTSPQSNEGLHMTDIGQRLSMDSGVVMKGAEELLVMGLIYTTVDDQTWALLNM